MRGDLQIAEKLQWNLRNTFSGFQTRELVHYEEELKAANQNTVQGVLEAANKYIVQRMLCLFHSGFLSEEPQCFSDVGG